MKAITGQIASCIFSLGSQPPDMKFVNVTLGATEIPFDVANQNGWNFNAGDTSTINVVGSWVRPDPRHRRIRVGIVFGCKPPIIPTLS